MPVPVLLVEDDLQIRWMMRRMLGRGGYAVQEVGESEACLAALRGGFSGVVLLDIGLPDRTGWETLRLANEEGLLARCLVCVFTGAGAPGTDQEALTALVFDYIPKPFTPEQLLELVGNAAGNLPSS